MPIDADHLFLSVAAGSSCHMKSKKYPLATVIGYGPDYQTATKLVVSIFKKPGQPDPAAMEKWIVQGGDIRQNPGIMTAVTDFIKRHHAVETVTYDRLLGCPHEEGIDYPEGAVLSALSVLGKCGPVYLGAKITGSTADPGANSRRAFR